MALSNHFEAIQDHLDKYFNADDEIIVFHEKESPDFHLDIYWIKPSNNRDFSILMSNGISSIPLKVPNENLVKYIELCILLPNEWDLNNENWKKEENFWPIKLLKNIGRYPIKNNAWLGFGHTTQLENKIVGTEFIATILLKSKTLPLEFQKIKYDSNVIELYILFPLYYDELEYNMQNGTNKLLDLFTNENISDIINIKRKNVCINMKL